MADKYIFFAYGVISLMFISGITYYVILFALVRNLKVRDAKLWADYKGRTRMLESDFMTAYKIIINNKKCHGIELSVYSNKLAKVAKYNLYISMIFFMLVLSVGLYLSVNK